MQKLEHFLSNIISARKFKLMCFDKQKIAVRKFRLKLKTVFGQKIEFWFRVQIKSLNAKHKINDSESVKNSREKLQMPSSFSMFILQFSVYIHDVQKS